MGANSNLEPKVTVEAQKKKKNSIDVITWRKDISPIQTS